MVAQAETSYGRAFERARAAVRNLAFAGLALAWLISESVNHQGYSGSVQKWGTEPFGLRVELRWVVALLLVVLALDLLDLLGVALLWPRRASREPGRLARAWLGLSAVAVGVGLVILFCYADVHLIVGRL
jgi:hypothetical protein